VYIDSNSGDRREEEEEEEEEDVDCTRLSILAIQ